MTTWLIWPTGHLQVRIAVLGVCFASVPLVAGVAILRYRLYEIDVVVNRTLVYAAVTVILAAAFAATVVLLGTALGRRLGVGDRRRHARRRGRVPPAARAGAGRGRPPLQPRPLRRAAADGRLPRGPARRPGGPRGGRGRPARGAVATRGWSSSSSCPRASSTSTRADYPSPTSRTTGARGSRSSAAAQPLGDRAPRARERGSIPPCCAGSSRPAGWRSRSRGCASSCAASSPRSRPRARGSSPPPTRSAGGSSATSTTAPSSGSSRSGSRCATPSTSSRSASPERAEPDARRRGRRGRRRDRRAARARARAAARRSSTPGWRRRFRELARRAPLPVEVDAAGRALRPRRRGRRLLHRLRGPHQRRQARPRHAGSSSAPARRDRQLVVSVADDGVGGAIAGHGLRPARASPTASPPSAARCGSTATPAPARP